MNPRKMTADDVRMGRAEIVDNGKTVTFAWAKTGKQLKVPMKPLKNSERREA